MWLWRNGFTNASGTIGQTMEVVESEAAGKLWSIVERAWVGSPLPEDKKEVSAGWRRERGGPLVWFLSSAGPEPIDPLLSLFMWGSDSLDKLDGSAFAYFTILAKPSLLSVLERYFVPREGPRGELLSLSGVLVFPGRTTLAYQFTLNYSQIYYSTMWSRDLQFGPPESQN